MPPKKKTFQAGDRVQFRLKGFSIRATVLEVKGKKCRIQSDTPGAGEVELTADLLEASS